MTTQSNSTEGLFCSDPIAMWHYYQNYRTEVFSDAQPRLEHLVSRIKAKTRRCNRQDISVLNIGVGDGYLERLMRDAGWHSYSLDLDHAAIKRVSGIGIAGVAGSIAELPFIDATFDFVVASEVLEHLTDVERRHGIAEVRRVLKPNGWFLGTVPYRENLIDNYVFCPRCGNAFHRWGHQSAFDLESLRHELSAQLDVMELRRMAFVRFWERPLAGKIKSLARLVLAKYGCAIAVPSIYFAAQKRA